MTMKTRAALAALLGLVSAAPAIAQAGPAAGDEFRGSYAGVEAGLVANRFVLEVTDGRTGTAQDFTFSRGGIGGGVFAGHDWAPARWLRLGVEAGAVIGGRTPVARFGDGDYAREPRFGLRLAGRVGVVPVAGLMAYATLGYAGQNARERDGVGVDGGDWQHTAVVGGGVQYRLSDRIDLRIEGRHLPGAGDQIMVGLPIRF